jgi:NAD(P)-dependent dehydrogenase (short-subunit alcohol dehydrogenase family)
MISWKYVVALLAVLLAMFLANLPHKELEWDDQIVPMAQAFAKINSTETPLDGKIVVVTGATSGIGLSLTKMLSRLGATVVAVGRSPSKLAALQEEIPTVQTVQANLVDLQSVADAADAIAESWDHIDVLVNNAGVHDGFNNLFGEFESKQGYDQVFGVNYLSHFLLTEKLAPKLMNSSNPTIVQVASSYHWTVDGSDLMAEDGQSPIASQKGGSHGFLAFRSTRSYANSKLAQILHARALKQKHPLLASARIVSVCPGWVKTQIDQSSGPVVGMLVSAGSFDVDGWGLSSVLLSLLDPLNTGDFYSNTKLFDIAPYALAFQRPWMYQVGIRDMIGQIMALFVLGTQRALPEAKAVKSSPESYDVILGDSLYDWSMNAVKPYL